MTRVTLKKVKHSAADKARVEFNLCGLKLCALVASIPTVPLVYRSALLGDARNPAILGSHIEPGCKGGQRQLRQGFNGIDARTG